MIRHEMVRNTYLMSHLNIFTPFTPKALQAPHFLYAYQYIHSNPNVNSKRHPTPARYLKSRLGFSYLLQRRIAFARAMLKNAPILVLDEAISALDSESEVAIKEALQTLMTGKTVIAIAHRLSTLREMDRIIMLESR